MRKPKRMGVLQAGTNGTELAPCLRIKLDGSMAEVLVETEASMITIKATEIRVGDRIRFAGGCVTRVRIAKRVAVAQEGYRGSVTYPLESFVQVERAGTARRRTCKEYVDTPLPDTAAHWEAAYTRLETAWAQQAAQA